MIRKRRRALVLALLPLLAYASGWAAIYAYVALGGEPAKPSVGFEGGRTPIPNLSRVLLVTFDALRADHVSAYGYARETTPNLDRLADRGVVFIRALATSSWTYPSLASLFTAAFPRTHGVFGPDSHVRPERVMPVMEFLHAGTRTAMFAAHAFDSLRVDEGFAERTYEFRAPASKLTDDAIAWLTRAGDAPFFLWLHYFEPHCPYDPPADLPPLPSAGRPLLGDPYGACPRTTSVNPSDFSQSCGIDGATNVDAYMDRYDRSIRGADRELGRLVDFVRARPGAEETLIVVSADHGEAFGDHGMVEHASWIFEVLLRVPLIVHLGRDLPMPRRIEEPVSMADVLPTIGDLVLGRVPEGVEGRSLRTAIETGRATRRPLAAEVHETLKDGESSAAVRFGDIKVMRDGGAGEPFYYYDLAADPCERAKRVVTWTTLLRSPTIAYLRGVLARSLAVPYPTPPHLDPATRERLRKLGYVRD
jgi:arylsulfatase A-like enzyme